MSGPDPDLRQRMTRASRPLTGSPGGVASTAAALAMIRSTAPTTRPPAACGVSSRFGASQSVEPAGRGSGSVTSIPASLMVPERRAASRAA